jgi:serine/threonine protein phosphatase PrpC
VAAKTIADIDEDLVAKGEVSDTCAVLAIVRRDGAGHGGGAPVSLVVANVGDSRAVLGRRDQGPLVLSDSHKPGDAVERARIEAAGGQVLSVTYTIGQGESVAATDRIKRPGSNKGGLAVSRALGDSPYKQQTTLSTAEQLVVSVPSVKTHMVTAGDDFLVLASDGVWDVMSNQEVIDLVKMHWNSTRGA